MGQAIDSWLAGVVEKPKVWQKIYLTRAECGEGNQTKPNHGGDRTDGFHDVHIDVDLRVFIWQAI